ncbi:cysteine hydrolase family protein [Rhizobium puerariae]|uniref:Cysteine hydrolase family protein n=1 Tax=Rhizobium puerariae TaxID=1585791 RepID=A0ABV6AJA2_9HYPH
MPSQSRDQILSAYMETYGLDESQLMEDSVSETKAVLDAAADYALDRHDAFEIKPERCALVVIDMQVGFVAHGSAQWIPQAERMLPPLIGFADACRDAGIPVLLTSANTLSPAPNDAPRFSKAMAEGNLGDDAPGLEIMTGLHRKGDYLITTKRTYDSFYGTDLDMQLRSRGRDTVIITGTMTNYCCEATARSAFDRGYHVVFMSDLTATDIALCHEATLLTMRRGYARVMDRFRFLQEIGVE